MYSTLKKIWIFAKDEQKNIIQSTLLNVINSIFYMFQIGAIYYIMLGITSKSPSPKIGKIALLLMLVSIVGRGISNTFAQLKNCHAGYFMVANRRIEIGNKLKTVPMGFLNNKNLGNITGVMTSVLDDVENNAPVVLVVMVTGLISTLVFTVMLFLFDIRIGLIVTIGIFVYLFLTSKMDKKSADVAEIRQRTQRNLVGSILEHIKAMPVVKSFNLTGEGDEKVRNAIEDSENSNLSMEKAITPYLIAQNLTLQLFSVIMIIFALKFYISGTMSLSNVVMTIIMSFTVFNQISLAGSQTATLRVVSSSIDEANQLYNMPAMDIEGKMFDVKDFDIRFQNVDFSYNSQEVLKDINCLIPENKLTAIVGPSGSGKTTMCNLISRFWDVNRGSVKIGGIDVRDLKLENLMSNISMVFQRVYLFEDSIENNIKFGNQDATKEEVIEAAKKASCHDFIMKLPEKYDTIIGEGGASLSGGEKQRISIARAMLKNANIIIFDEATANVDPENEDKLQNAIENLTRDKTVIMIAHRLKTIENADQIIVLNEGKIENIGIHKDLVKTEGTYKKFVELRSKAENWKL
ncbi:TPA: ABC transporter ATP-binding protein [Streptococcus agalactiae]|uniref:ABC transporter ATP-binding protein n=1 Tax=Finegoldia magna TaxID=1260 RepID=UPI00280480BF|nr:ABC transporter ATP-binding protein [Finegoldia magna]MDU5071221.1 ABC transporter ATP-binding protein [Finegoldia magna]